MRLLFTSTRNNNTIQVNGTGPAGAEIVIKTESGEILTSTTADAQGNWTATFTLPNPGTTGVRVIGAGKNESMPIPISSEILVAGSEPAGTHVSIRASASTDSRVIGEATAQPPLGNWVIHFPQPMVHGSELWLHSTGSLPERIPYSKQHADV
jgi:hypothetical protein